MVFNRFFSDLRNHMSNYISGKNAKAKQPAAVSAEEYKKIKNGLENSINNYRKLRLEMEGEHAKYKASEKHREFDIMRISELETIVGNRENSLKWEKERNIKLVEEESYNLIKAAKSHLEKEYAIVVDRKEKILYASPKAIKLFGLDEKEELQGKNYSSFLWPTSQREAEMITGSMKETHPGRLYLPSLFLNVKNENSKEKSKKIEVGVTITPFYSDYARSSKTNPSHLISILEIDKKTIWDGLRALLGHKSEVESDDPQLAEMIDEGIKMIRGEELTEKEKEKIRGKGKEEINQIEKDISRAQNLIDRIRIKDTDPEIS